MITAETVSHVAKLARLSLSADETARLTQDMGNILSLVDQITQMDLPAEELALHTEEPTLFRKDEQQKNISRDTLLENAHDWEEDGFFRVPRIMDDKSAS